ncbi:hypothetical protein DW083_07365 [Parabacteroides sp. AF48-14]|uniref:GLUG motif-containing protein n=1 Tax=Parabacteroides sp. AF48-14 TaxID=2292052 RepID=UPI000F0013EA|nr:hypothetical protein DW083_07365 [Parabacteroides sp. AF48-14]
MVQGLKIEIKIEDVTLSNLSIYAGLFGYLSGNVRNLGIQVATAGIKVKGKYVYAGALAGYNEGAIQNCFAIGNNSAIIDAEASIGYLGGLIGKMEHEGSITNCYATLNVKGTVASNELVYAGGLVGYSKSQGNISHVYATGKIEATGQGYPYMGGVVGIAAGGTFSHALAANKDNITTANRGSLGRVCGNVYISDAICDTTTCYASTKIRVNGKVTGVGGSSIGKHFDGINADTDTDLSELFPTGGDAVWNPAPATSPSSKASPATCKARPQRPPSSTARWTFRPLRPTAARPLPSKTTSRPSPPTPSSSPTPKGGNTSMGQTDKETPSVAA